MSGGRRGERRRTHGVGTKGMDGYGYMGASEREKEQIRERELLSLSLSLSLWGRRERGWIKASTRGGNKERTKKVEEVGGGGWVPWSALIGSTWSDEKFNHPPIPTRSNALSLPPPPLVHLHLLFALSFSVSRAIRTIVHPFTRRPDSHQMNLPHIYAHPDVYSTFLRIRMRRQS